MRGPPDQLGQVIEPRNVAMMNTMMQETLLSGTARKAEIPGWMAAGKTGTSQDFRDAWFIGYTANLVTGVWLGNDDNSPTKKATGGGLPVEVWTRFMRAAHQGVAAVALPGSQAGGFFSNLVQAASHSQRARGQHADLAATSRRRPAGADANLGAPGSGERTRRLADGSAVRAVGSVLDAVAMQIVAVGIEPGLGALDMVADLARPPARTAPNDSSRRDAPLHGRRDNPARKAARGSAATRTTANPPRCTNPSGSTDRGSTAA